MPISRAVTHRVAVERHLLLAAAHLGRERHVVDRVAGQSDTMIGRSRPSASARTAAAPNRSARRRSNDVGDPPRSRCPSTTVRASLPVRCSSPSATRGTDAAEALRCGRLALAASMVLLTATDRRGSLGDDDDRELRSVLAGGGAIVSATGIEIEGDLGDQDRMRTRRDAGVQCDPSRVAAHHLDDDHAPVRGGRREQTVDALRREAHGRCRNRRSTIVASRGRCRSSSGRRSRAGRASLTSDVRC